MIKIDKEHYVDLFTDVPNWDMFVSGWTYDVKWFLGVIPFVIYYKKANF